MKIEWDPSKARTILEKHDVHFADAELVLFDPNALTREDTGAEGEQRFVTIGSDTTGRILIVVYSISWGNIRMISARPATKKERKSYEEGI